jgi:methyl-accepting chemotaxis protein
VLAVNEVAAGLNRMAENNLTSSIETPFPKDLEVLRLDYNKSLHSMRGALQQVATAANSIGSGTSQLTIASDNLSRRTEQQAANLEQTAAALDQITAAALKATEGALQAREAVSVADKDAKKSADIVRKAVEAMDAISKSSAQINNIIGVIDEIAFQTNLLALNAGVEAARAGDSGRGFAVVAQEVRALAQRSADAAKEIKTLIGASTRQVDDGVELVGETGQSLERITQQVSGINSIVDAIALGSKEQSTALSEVNTAINQMDQLTQQNAAMVEESTAASRSLANEAGDLTKLLAQYRLGAAASGAKHAPQTYHGASRATTQDRHVSRPKPMRAASGASAKTLLAAQPEEEWDEF